MIKMTCSCDVCKQIIDTKKRYYRLNTKGEDSEYYDSMDICNDCFNALKNLKENKNEKDSDII